MIRTGWILPLVLFCSCEHSFEHEKYLENLSSDTVFVVNPDFDTIFVAPPITQVKFYDFRVLDTKQEREDCRWLGDSLYIFNTNDSLCTKNPKVEANWISTVEGPEKERIQKCVFHVDNDDF